MGMLWLSACMEVIMVSMLNSFGKVIDPLFDQNDWDVLKNQIDKSKIGLFNLILYVPVNNFSVMSGQVFLTGLNQN